MDFMGNPILTTEGTKKAQRTPRPKLCDLEIVPSVPFFVILVVTGLSLFNN
jgi:hypothetical protein